MARSITLGVVLSLWLSAHCFGLGHCVQGNAPQSAANYQDWPGLIDVVNDPARLALCWVNGSESLWYAGDASILNRLLKEFAEVEGDELHVLLRPGAGHTVTIDGKTVDFDCCVRVIGGIARQSMVMNKQTDVWDMHPTLTLFVTDELDLEAISIPTGLQVFQVQDLRQRYLDARVNGNFASRQAADRLLRDLHEEANRPGDDYRKKAARIEAYVRTLSD